MHKPFVTRAGVSSPTRRRSERETAVSLGDEPDVSGGCLPSLTLIVRHSNFMHPDSRLPNDAQRKKLCEMLSCALTEIRGRAGGGQFQRASDLADAFHNLPHEMWCEYFSTSFFRDAFFKPYYRQWPVEHPHDYLAMIEEVERLK